MGGVRTTRKGGKEAGPSPVPGPLGFLEKGVALLKLGGVEGLGEGAQRATQHSITRYNNKTCIL